MNPLLCHYVMNFFVSHENFCLKVYFIWSKYESESEVAQSCPTLCDSMDCSPPGSSVHGILQARILEWVAIFFSRGSSWPRDWTQISHIAGRGFNLWATREAPRCLLHCIFMEYILPSPHFQFMCVLKTEVLRQNIVGCYFLSVFVFNWRIIACCIDFYYTMWISSKYAYIHFFLSWNEVDDPRSCYT